MFGRGHGVKASAGRSLARLHALVDAVRPARRFSAGAPGSTGDGERGAAGTRHTGGGRGEEVGGGSRGGGGARGGLTYNRAPDAGGESPLLHLAPVQAAPAAERGELGEGAVPRLRVPLTRPYGGRGGRTPRLRPRGLPRPGLPRRGAEHAPTSPPPAPPAQCPPPPRRGGHHARSPPATRGRLACRGPRDAAHVLRPAPGWKPRCSAGVPPRAAPRGAA